MRLKSLGLLPVLFCAAVPLSAATIFTDSTFTLGNYSQVIYNSDTADVTVTVQQTASGNPGTAMEVLNTWSTPNITFTTITGLINTTFFTTHPPRARFRVSTSPWTATLLWSAAH
jgi:hypothetical protein